MAHFLFVDESGQDLKESPCEVLAGVALRDSTLWPFVNAVHKAELDCFGTRYSAGAREIKARKLLKTKVFRHAALQFSFASTKEQRDLATKVLQSGAKASLRECAALAKAKLEFVHRLFDLCAKFKFSLFACIVPKDASRPSSRNFLRKNYAYLFERFFYFLEDKRTSGAGIIVFDELEKTRSHILIQQMDSYFKRTHKGRERSEIVIPEPFFVHSDLTTGIQVADLMAYLLAWGYYKAKGRSSPARPELVEFADQGVKLAYNTSRRQGSRRIKVWGITIIQDLRARSERE